MRVFSASSANAGTVLAHRRRRRFIKTVTGVLGIPRMALLIGLGFVIVYPLLVKISSSFMTVDDIYDRTVQWVPRNPSLNNLEIAFTHMEYPQALLTSVAVVCLLSLLQVASCTMVGYSLGRFRYPGSRLLFALVLLMLVVPPQLVLIPLYLNFRFFNFLGVLPSSINLIGSFWPMILMSGTATGLRNGLLIYIMRQFFKGMPKDLEEAAYVDGAGLVRTFVSVMLPNAVPALIIVFLFSFVWQWNDTFYVSLFAQGRNLLSLKLLGVADSYAQFHLQVHGFTEPLTDQEYSMIQNAGSLLFIAPVLVLYGLLQRHFVESIERTGLVG